MSRRGDGGGGGGVGGATGDGGTLFQGKTESKF